jgi:hypothetical protein
VPKSAGIEHIVVFRSFPIAAEHVHAFRKLPADPAVSGMWATYQLRGTPETLRFVVTVYLAHLWCIRDPAAVRSRHQKQQLSYFV